MSTWTSTTRPVSLSIAAIPTSRATPLLSKRATVIAESACFVPGRDVLGRAVLVRVVGRDVLGRVELSVVLGRDMVMVKSLIRIS